MVIVETQRMISGEMENVCASDILECAEYNPLLLDLVIRFF